MTTEEAKQTSQKVQLGVEFFLNPMNTAKRLDFDWGSIYWVGGVLRVDVKNIGGNCNGN